MPLARNDGSSHASLQALRSNKWARQASSTTLRQVCEAKRRRSSHKVCSSRADACPTKAADRLRGIGLNGEYRADESRPTSPTPCRAHRVYLCRGIGVVL